MPGRGVFKLVAQIPLLAPSLLPAIGLVYLFGNQGLAKGLLFGALDLRPDRHRHRRGVLDLSARAHHPDDGAGHRRCAPLRSGGSAARQRLARVFWTVTLPGVRYGLISATFVVFTLVITDFGVPKVIGGQYNVLATDIYKQVIGQQNFRWARSSA